MRTSLLQRGYVESATRVHDLSAQSKIVGVAAFVLIVVLTPREWIGAFVAYALLVGAALVIARIPPRRILTGLVIEIPFVAFALLLPVIHPGPEGLWAAWNILIKASLGVLAATVLAATTLPVDLVAGLQALRLPAPIVAIFTFFIRYVDVVADEYRRMVTAAHVRGMRMSSPAAWPALASGLGSLFVRSYERGERVHLALVSRGYNGRLPQAPTATGGWQYALVLPVCAACVFAVTAVLRW